MTPTEVNWKGIRNIPAPPVGGTGLSDCCMLWPVSRIQDVEWDSTIKYGYAEAWLAAQAKNVGINIRIVMDISVLHRRPGRGESSIKPNDFEIARIYYNFRIKSLKGKANAVILLLLDFILTNGKRLGYGKRPRVREYFNAISLIKNNKWKRNIIQI